MQLDSLKLVKNVKYFLTIIIEHTVRTIQSSLSWLGRACSIIPLEPVKMKGKDAPRCTDVRA